MFKKILVAMSCLSEASKIFNHALSIAQADESESYSYILLTVRRETYIPQLIELS